jgi:hypothetical protein
MIGTDLTTTTRTGAQSRRPPQPASTPLRVVVDYRFVSSDGWLATLHPVDAPFAVRNVHAEDSAGILVAVLRAIEKLRLESGKCIQLDQRVHNAFIW